MSLSLAKRILLNIASRKGVCVVSQEEAGYFSSLSRAQALEEMIVSLQRQLPALQAAVSKTSAEYVKVQLILRETVEKVESARAERNLLLGKNNHKRLTEGTQLCLTGQQST